MKKLMITLFLAMMFVLLATPNAHGASDFRFVNETRERRFVEGIEHIAVKGQLTYNGETKSQHYNYLGVNTQTTDYNIVTVDNYQPFAWGMSNLLVQIDTAKQRFPHLDFVGGVNGDFYDINNTGRANQTHIVNFEVLHRGSTGSSRTAVGFTDDGDMIYGTPSYLGQHINILNEYRELKMRIKVNRINALPQNDLEVAIYHDNFANEIPDGYHKVVVKASDIKTDGSGNRNYSKGVMESRTPEPVTVSERYFVLVGKMFQDENLITDTDTILVQELLGNGFENARFSMGTGVKLVENGNIPYQALDADPYRHPRTAIGQKADGTIFFIIVDGRDVLAGKNGVRYSELAELMKMHGAVVAFNLDGGGSSTMVLRNEESGEYDVLNTLSDGRIRSVSNGLIFAKGDLEPVFVQIPYPDTRTPYDAPTGLYMDESGIFHFLGNDENKHYTLKINGKEMYLTNETIPLLLAPGQYEIEVRVKGNETYSTSAYSETYTYNVHKADVQRILDLMRQMASGS